jgi:FkbM family methyltransferase
MLGRLLGILNRVPIGERGVRFGDARLYADSLDRWVAAVGWSRGWMARRETLLLDRVLRPGMVCVDVGANIGFHTLAMARRVGPQGRVHALEPAPANFRLLARAVREAAYRQVVLHQLAATDAPGTVTLHLSAVNRGDHRLTAAAEPRGHVPVRGQPLDALLAGEARVDLVKIDAQGAEVTVLRGLAGTLARVRDLRLLVELSPALLARAGADREAFFGPLRALGFQTHVVAGDGTTPVVDEAEAWARAERRYDMVWLERPGASPAGT